MRVLIAFLLVGGALAVPVPISKEEEICDQAFTRFVPNQRYTYRYVATTVTGVTGTTNQTTGLRIEATCEINALADCRRSLWVKDVRIFEASPNGEKDFKSSPNQESFKRALEANHLVFSERRGRFVMVLPVKTEPVYITNIKRGILSALQLQFSEKPQEMIHEVDVTGNCTSEYKIVNKQIVESEITKKRDLSNCTSRSHNITKLNPVTYDVNSQIQGPLNSTSFCRYIVREKHIKTVECNETHLLRPFSYNAAGVTTNVTVNLTLESVRMTFFFADEMKFPEMRKSNMFYEQSLPKAEAEPVYETSSKSAEDVLEGLIKILPINETKPSTVTKFTRLVFSIRKLDVNALKNVWTRFYNCDEQQEGEFTKKQCKKSQAYLLDAFTQCGTTPCLRYIIEAIRDYNQVKPEHMAYLLNGISAARNPAPYLFDEMIDFLRRRSDLPTTTRLSLGTMIRKYCQRTPEDCLRESDSAVMRAVSFLEEQLPKNCEATSYDIDDVIITLKAIGNAGLMHSKAKELVKCSQGANFLNISVVAIETIRSMPFCPDTWNALGSEVFGDYGNDPEVRLQAYLALMKYPDEKTIRFVAQVLDGEVNTQVGAFVSSHLKQMNDSVEPTYGKRLSELIKKALKQRTTPLRDFNTTYKSQFLQKSYLNEENNLGFSTESHVIYHPESLVPRSAELNVTLDLWGGAIPVVETSTRLEGLEIIWEKLFGHKGYFPDSHISGLMKTPEKSENEAREIQKRSVDNVIDLETLDRKVNLRKMTPSGLLSLKLFGNELDLFRLKDLEWLEDDDIPIADLIELLRALSKGVDKTFTKSFLFLEETHIIPTCLGIPLNLSINGTSVTSVHVQGKADLLSLFWGNKKAVVKGTVKPSAAIVISGKVTLDAFHLSTGVLLNGSISTSTELQGNLTYSQEQGLKSHVNVTEKPQEILNITTSLFHHFNNEEIPIRGVDHRNTTGICTTDIFNSTKILGLNLCSNISIPVAWYNKTAPFFPLTGPSNFFVYLNRTDPLLKNLKMEVNFTKPDKHTNKTAISVSTPGANYERRFFCNITSNKTEEMYRWNISVGADHENATTIDYIFVPISKAVNITFNVTRNLTAFYFHRTCHKTHKIKYGLAMNATLFNKSFHHSFFMMNDTHKWHLETNTTVKNTTESIPISVLYLNTSINLNGNTTGNMTLNITHRPLNLTLHLRGQHNMTTRTSNVTWNVSCPTWSTPILNNNITINVSYVNTTSFYKTHVNVFNNGTQVLSCYKAYRNSTEKNITVFFCNATAFNRTSSLNMTVTNATDSIKICHLNITHQNRSIALNTTWMYNHEVRNVSLNITYLNHSVVLSGSLKNYTLEKGFCFNSAYFNGTHHNFTLLSTCLSYFNATERKSLILNITSLNSTATMNTTWFAKPTARGILVNCTYQNRTIFNMTATYSNTTTTRNLHFNLSMGNWSAELNHTYFSTEMLPEVDQIRSINITHRIRNGTSSWMNASYVFTFFNTTAKKDLIVNLTFTNRTYGAQVNMVNKTTTEMVHHILRITGYTPNRTVSWMGVLTNSSKVFNLTSVLQYQPKKILNQTFVWNKEISQVNVSIDFLPNVSFSLNCSGTFNTSIRANANATVYNNTLLWNGFVGNMSVVSNLTLWNRTIEFVTKTCNKSHSAFFNLSTWHHFNKTAFNGSITWSINATERVSYFNITSRNVTWFLKMFSLNDTHFNNTIYRINGSEMYVEWSREVRGDNTVYDVLNMTSVRYEWSALNNLTFHIPTKLANITLNATLAGVNMTKFRTHFKYVLKNITQEMLLWNYTKENIAQNLFNLTIHLLNTTSHSIPNVTVNYQRYFQGDTFNYSLFYNNLANTILKIKESNVTLENITEELIVILQNFTDHVNTTAFLGNISNIIGNTTWYNQTCETFIFNLTEWGRNASKNFTMLLNRTVSEIGNWTINNKTVNYYLKTYLPGVQNLTIEILNETVNFTQAMVNVSLVFRNFTHNVTEYILNVTHPVLYSISRQILVNITGYINNSSFLGGVAYPVWQNFTEVADISVFNLTYELFHNWTICDSSFEWFLSSLHYPMNITLSFHNITSDATLYQATEGLLNKTLEIYNATVRSPACRMNRSHEWLVNVTDLAVILVNDTVNVLNVTSLKTTQEIIELYINRTHNMTSQLWNMTVQILTATNFSEPPQKSWEMLNFTAHYHNWTHSMPWTRPVLKRWNSTMLEVITVMRNHSWQNYTRYYFPRVVRYTAEPIESDIYVTAWFLRNFPSNTTLNQKQMNSSFTYPMYMRINYTQFLHLWAEGYINMTACSLNATRNATEFILNGTYNFTVLAVNITTNWTQTFYKFTFTLVNSTASFVNGSLVNETIFHNAHLPKYFYFNLMNFTMNITDHAFNYSMCMLDQTLREYVNKTLSPVITTVITWRTHTPVMTWRTLKALNELKPEDIVEMLQPKNQTGMIFGKNIYTFDKRYFRFPWIKGSNCKYLVSRDFKDGNFTILSSPEVIVIITQDALVNIHRNGEVISQGITGMDKTNGLTRDFFKELPVKFENTTIVRDGPFINLTNDFGFSVECDMEHFACSFEVSGFYHNRTAGILGTNNGEPSDDWISPNGKNRTQVSDFVSSWHVGGDCNVKPGIEVKQIPCNRDESAIKRCSKLFLNKSSPLSKCFSEVNPVDFAAACKAEYKDCDVSAPVRTLHCNVTAAYIRQCKRHGIEVSLPDECTSCEVGSNMYEKNSTWKEKPSSKVDIVFVCSQGEDMEPVAALLPSFTQQIDQYMKKEGMSPQFGLVGFSGKVPVHRPGHEHTIKGQLFNSAKYFTTDVIRNMRFVPRSNREFPESDGYLGLMKATEYPFRPAASKLIVLVTNSIRVNHSNISSETVVKALKDIGARLVLIGKFPLKKAIAIDTFNNAYMKKGISKAETKSLIKLYRPPQNDEYFQVVTETQGVGINLKPAFEGPKAKPYSWQMQMILESIFKQLKHDTAQCRECSCVPDMVGKGKTVCKTVPCKA